MRPRPARHRDPLPRPRTRRRTRATTRRRRPLPHRSLDRLSTAGRRSYVAVTSQRRAISRAMRPKAAAAVLHCVGMATDGAVRRPQGKHGLADLLGMRHQAADSACRVARQLESSSMKDAAPRRYVHEGRLLEFARRDWSARPGAVQVRGTRRREPHLSGRHRPHRRVCQRGVYRRQIGPSQDLGISFSEAEPERCRASEHHVKTVTTHHAKTHLSRLLREVHAGETIVILSGSAPVAQLIAIRPERASRPPVGTRTSAASPRPFRSTAGGGSDQGERGRPDPRRRRPPISSEPPVGRVRSDDNEMDHVALAN